MSEGHPIALSSIYRQNYVLGEEGGVGQNACV